MAWEFGTKVRFVHQDEIMGTRSYIKVGDLGRVLVYNESIDQYQIRSGAYTYAFKSGELEKVD